MRIFQSYIYLKYQVENQLSWNKSGRTKGLHGWLLYRV